MNDAIILFVFLPRVRPKSKRTKIVARKKRKVARPCGSILEEDRRDPELDLPIGNTCSYRGINYLLGPARINAFDSRGNALFVRGNAYAKVDAVVVPRKADLRVRGTSLGGDFEARDEFGVHGLIGCVRKNEADFALPMLKSYDVNRRVFLCRCIQRKANGLTGDGSR